MTGAPAASEEELDALFDAIVAAVQAADRPLALRRAVHAVGRGLDDPLALMLAAESATETGDHPSARGLLSRAAALAPEEAETWRRLGETLVAEGRLNEADEALGRALELQPDSGPALLALASVSFRLGKLSDAETRFETAARALPLAAAPIEGLAAIAARRGDGPRARSLADRAATLDGPTIGGVFTLCRADLLEGRAAEAAARLDPVIARADLPVDAKIAALDLRANCRDALDNTDGAFADYLARNRLIASSAPTRSHDAGRPTQQASRIARGLASDGGEAWKDPVAEDWEGGLKTQAHVFLVGFPRSGTTLLEKMLAGHPAVVTLQEVDRLGEAAGDLLKDDNGFARLRLIGADEVNRRRLIYWRGVRETLGAGFVGRVLVDKLPLHTLALPAIARLFPAARVLFALRDPRDVVFSCFRRRFQLNAAMAEFLELPSAAAFYDAVMGLARVARDVLPLPTLDVRMERMIEDFDSESARVLRFMGMGWDDRVRDFAGLARDNVRTPSDLQLQRGLNDAGIGQWRRYERSLDPVLPVLRPWVEAFGYS